MASVDDKEMGMNAREFDVPGVKLILPKRFSDARGYFCETWNDRIFRQEIANVAFVQDNQSVSAKKGTLRGLHFQKPPFAQGKLVRAVRGSILDIAVDIRKGSPTYRQHVATKLDALEGAQLWVPPGFLHGFCTLEDETEVFYKVTEYFSADHDAGVLWSDPDLGISWPVDIDSIVLSEKDRTHPLLRDLPDFFHYNGCGWNGAKKGDLRMHGVNASTGPQKLSRVAASVAFRKARRLRLHCLHSRRQNPLGI